ncbi:hypothetical protein BQ1740_1357 [Bacillus subtilis]|nr:hypothetical protein BQ1740_1357 [Bacillus subtilis]
MKGEVFTVMLLFMLSGGAANLLKNRHHLLNHLLHLILQKTKLTTFMRVLLTLSVYSEPNCFKTCQIKTD